MAAEFSVEGMDELLAKMDVLREEIGNAKTDAIWRKALRYAMEPVLQDARSLAPEDTGELEKHIYMKVHRPMARDKAGKYYAGEVYMARVTSSPLRDDSVKSFTLNKKGRLTARWSNLKPVPVSQEFGNARTPANPYMRLSLENNMDKVSHRLGWSVWAAIEEVNAKKKV